MSISKTKKLAIIAVAAIFIASAVQAQQMQIAVLDFRAGAGVEQGDVDGISAIFGTYFHNPQKFRLVERTQIERVIREQGFQHSTLTNQQMARVGQILNVQKIVVGDINIISGQHNVDVRVVDVQTGLIEATEGAMWARGTSHRELMRGLAIRLMAKIQIPPTPAPTPAPTITTPTSVITLFDHLHVFPEDIGEFHGVPTNVIATINQNAMHGYNSWRIPTNEELALMRANASRLGLRGGVTYMTSDGARSGTVRLVTTGRTVAQQQTEVREGVRIAGVNWATGNVGLQGRFVAPSEPGILYNWYDARNACPPGWRLPTRRELENLHNTAGRTFAHGNTRGNQIGGYFYGPNHAHCSLPNNMAGCIFLPAVGWYFHGSPRERGTLGYYWSSTRNENTRDTRTRIFVLHFDSVNTHHNSATGIQDIITSSTASVRCVR